MTSTLQQSKVQSAMIVDAKSFDLVADTDLVVGYEDMPQSLCQLYVLRNVAADGAILTSLRVEALSVDPNGEPLAIDGSGLPVLKSTIDENTGLGTALTPAELAALPFTVVKDRIGMVAQTDTDSAAVPPRLDGDNGEVGNVYAFELARSEYGFQVERDCKPDPTIIRVVASVTGAGGTFAMASVQSGPDFTLPPATAEVIK